MTRSDCYRGKLAPLRCEPEKWLAESLAKAPGVVNVCPTDDSIYLARTSGQTPAALADLGRFQRQADFFSVPGVASVRVGRTCDGLGEEGLVVELLRCRTAPPEAMRRLEALAERDPASKDKTFAVSFSILGLLASRCAANDPNCLPLPYRDDEAPDYDPDGSRHVFPDLPERVLDGECAHDGDCFIAGCGNYCSSWVWRNYAGTCEGRRQLYESFCGCVSGRCRWFEQ